jgi:hypothetical protein
VTLRNRNSILRTVARATAGVMALAVSAGPTWAAPTVLRTGGSMPAQSSQGPSARSSTATVFSGIVGRTARSTSVRSEPAEPLGVMGKNLLLNGDLRAGSGDSPDHWRSEAWEQKPGMTSFQWLRSATGPGELRVVNRKPNDARWAQNLTLDPGWYYLSARIRAENVPSSAQGASLAILEGAISSLDLRGTTEWERRGFYLRVGPRGADVEVACRLGGFGSLNTGTVMCSDLRVVRVAAPPFGAGPRFDLDLVRRQYSTPPVGNVWTLVAAFAITLGLALLGWTMLGGSTLADVAAPTIPDSKSARR